MRPGTRAPSFTLADADTGVAVSDPWTSGPTVLAFFKVTCPVCQMAAPKVQALADGGARVVAIGEDPPRQLADYGRRHGQRVQTLTEPSPYTVSSAYGLDTVPALFLVDEHGVIVDAVSSWERDGWNRLAAAAGVTPVSEVGDGLPAMRPG